MKFGHCPRFGQVDVMSADRSAAPVPKSLPVACSLTSEELRRRETILLAEFRSAVTATKELAVGYAFRVSGEKERLALVADLMMAERDCCPFLTFQLTAEPNGGALTIRITGPEGTKPFEVHPPRLISACHVAT